MKKRQEVQVRWTKITEILLQPQYHMKKYFTSTADLHVTASVPEPWLLQLLHTSHAAETHPEVVFSVVEEEPDLPVAVGQEDFLQSDHVRMLQFS